jgi:hypothetical protein
VWAFLLLLLLVAPRAAAADWDAGRALSLVDGLAWAYGDKELDRWLGLAVSPEGPFAPGLRPPDRGRLQSLRDPTVYAVEAMITEQEHGWEFVAREAVVYTNRSAAPIETFVMRVFPGEALRDGVQVVGVWIDNRPVSQFALEGSGLFVELPERLDPGERVRVLLFVRALVPAFSPDAPERRMLSMGHIGQYGTADGVVNLGHWLPIVPPVDRRGKFALQPIRENTEHATYDPALFHVVLDVASDLAVATTGVEVHRAEDAGHATVVTVAGPAREFAVELLRGAAVTETEVGGTRIRVFHPRREPAMGHHLLEYAEGALREFSERFGRLSIAEIDVVEAPLAHVLGMEHSGLVLVDASHKGTPYHRSADHEWTVAHEVAHQWWAMDVGTDAGRTPWLDEALASWSADLYFEDRYGADAVATRRQLEIVEPIAALQARGLADLPADLEAWKYDLDQYAAIVYGRASLFFDRVRETIGEEALTAALRAYHADFRDRSATAEDLLDRLRARTEDPDEIDRLYTRWITEGHGYEDLLGLPRGEH